MFEPEEWEAEDDDVVLRPPFNENAAKRLIGLHPREYLELLKGEELSTLKGELATAWVEVARLRRLNPDNASVPALIETNKRLLDALERLGWTGE